MTATPTSRCRSSPRTPWSSSWARRCADCPRASWTSVRATRPRRAIGMRHRIAHEHDAVDDDIVWLVISRHARELRATIERLLDAQDGTPRPHDPT
ncbi:DUF86 domain-containing protein [Arsenicicoccus bolidensis]|uniref:HepT-like ribonuclease domain-containing protein n=1 Tax=Arsenicicoccus bolidensis TaxID=229480 RepID=UPI000A02AC5C|nr:HepT-like ribonuclease domain-containing protein [Arsenicicoccus bolidensis]